MNDLSAFKSSGTLLPGRKDDMLLQNDPPSFWLGIFLVLGNSSHPTGANDL
jgi:hypothetical protein